MECVCVLCCILYAKLFLIGDSVLSCMHVLFCILTLHEAWNPAGVLKVLVTLVIHV